jgi:hypothetical protein
MLLSTCVGTNPEWSGSEAGSSLWEVSPLGSRGRAAHCTKCVQPPVVSISGRSKWNNLGGRCEHLGHAVPPPPPPPPSSILLFTVRTAGIVTVEHGTRSPSVLSSISDVQITQNAQCKNKSCKVPFLVYFNSSSLYAEASRNYIVNTEFGSLVLFLIPFNMHSFNAKFSK